MAKARKTESEPSAPKRQSSRIKAIVSALHSQRSRLHAITSLTTPTTGESQGKRAQTRRSLSSEEEEEEHNLRRQLPSQIRRHHQKEINLQIPNKEESRRHRQKSRGETQADSQESCFCCEEGR